jgi:hypothetical protein
VLNFDILYGKLIRFLNLGAFFDILNVECQTIQSFHPSVSP